MVYTVAIARLEFEREQEGPEAEREKSAKRS